MKMMTNRILKKSVKVMQSYSMAAFFIEHYIKPSIIVSTNKVATFVKTIMQISKCQRQEKDKQLIKLLYLYGFMLQVMQQQSQAVFQASTCQTYFDLVQKIGSKGPYQKKLVWLFIWALYSGGVGQLGPTFFFIMQPYDCQAQGLLANSCGKLVCELPAQIQKQYLSQDFNAYTIPVQFGYQYCSGSQVVNTVYGFVYFGFLASVFLRAFIVDSFGRRPLMIFFNGIIALGSILSISSINIWVTGFGFFLVNCGADGVTKFSFNFLSEYYDPQLREKYSIIIQIFYTIGYILICGSSYLINDWRITAGIFIVIPTIAGFIFCIVYLSEIPRYLMKDGEEKTLKVLNRIAKINNRPEISHDDLAGLVNFKNSSQQKNVSPLILCKYGSLRTISVLYTLEVFIILTLFYGSSILVDTFSLNTYLVGVILACADFTVYVPTFILINKMKRKTTSLLLSLAIMAASMGLIFTEQQENCNFCFTQIVQILLLFIFRFSSNFIYVVILIYSNQLFPQKVRAASSILQLFGGLSMVINPALLSFFQREDLNPMIYFTTMAAVSFGIYCFLPETNGIVKEQIEEQAQARQEFTIDESNRKVSAINKSEES